MTFSSLGLIESVVRAVEREGYTAPTPIQEQAIPQLLAGRDLLGCAETGTGKTAAFALPILQRLAPRRGEPRIRALVLAPTRELAAQIGERFGAYGRYVGLRHAVIFGGVSQGGQERALRPPPEIVVATPGRLLDLCAQRLLKLDAVEIFVLDEADRMLDMGFIHDVRKIVAMLPKRRQTMLFSATMPNDILALAKNVLTDPVRVAASPPSTAAPTVEQRAYAVDKRDKPALLERLLRDSSLARVLVFTRTKHGAERVARQLVRARVQASALHGNKTQGQRERALEGFRRGAVRVLVATDIASRGIDVDGITHVINYDLPDVAESYVHRIGRTGRAGAAGVALSLCDGEERSLLRGIEKLTRIRIPVVNEQTRPLTSPPAAATHGNARPNAHHRQGAGSSSRRRRFGRRRAA